MADLPTRPQCIGHVSTRRSGRFRDNCGALMTRIELEPGEEQTVTFLLGQTRRSTKPARLSPAIANRERSPTRLSRRSPSGSTTLGSLQVKHARSGARPHGER